MSRYDRIKREIVDSTRWLSEHGYLGRLSSGGNISLRVPGEKIVAITPSGRSYFSLDLSDICIIDFERNSIEGSLAPSIESGMHIGVYKNRPDVNAVIHTHQPFASVLAIINKPIPALFDEIIVEIGQLYLTPFRAVRSWWTMSPANWATPAIAISFKIMAPYVWAPT
jgi:glutamate-1-semialdehyde 2,1-aminomutase